MYNNISSNYKISSTNDEEYDFPTFPNREFPDDDFPQINKPQFPTMPKRTFPTHPSKDEDDATQLDLEDILNK